MEAKDCLELHPHTSRKYPGFDSDGHILPHGNLPHYDESTVKWYEQAYDHELFSRIISASLGFTVILSPVSCLNFSQDTGTPQKYM